MTVELIVGLGNPGPEYAATRHNAGVWLLNELAARTNVAFRKETKFQGELARAELAEQPCWLLRPTTFMNLSGVAVASLAQFYKLSASSILVIHDELDLPPGTARLKRGGGHGGHNGLRDIIARLGGNQFLRLRLGIGHPGHRDGVSDYVLHKPSKVDTTQIHQAIDAALDVMPLVVQGELERAMHQLHST